MVGSDDGIGPVALGLGRKGINQPTAEDAANGRNEEQKPGAEGLIQGTKSGNIRLARWPHGRMIPGQFAQCIMFDAPRGHIEENRPEACHDADQDRQSEQPDLIAHPPLAQEPEFGQPGPNVLRVFGRVA